MLTTPSLLTTRLEAANPEGMRALAALDRSVHAAVEAAGLSAGFGHLLRLRASVINGCAYCIRLHTRDALDAGETSERVALVGVAAATAYFSDHELAALALLERTTQPGVASHAGGAELPEETRAAVIWTGIVINAWNRFSIMRGEVLQP